MQKIITAAAFLIFIVFILELRYICISCYFFLVCAHTLRKMPFVVEQKRETLSLQLLAAQLQTANNE